MRIKIDIFGAFLILLGALLIYFWGASNTTRPRIIIYQPEFNHVVKMDTCRIVTDTASVPLAIWYNDFIFMPDTAMMNNF
jgi:hypothetical protein